MSATLATWTKAGCSIRGDGESNYHKAPGRRVHQTGISWNDASGKTLRKWLEMFRKVFYDPACFAIMPMGFCYPGKGRSGDLPPRPECAGS